MQIFELITDMGGRPMVVVAPDLDEAERIHRIWAETHGLDQFVLGGLYPSSEDHLIASPLLAELASRSSAGVGYWDTEAGRWILAAPAVAPLGTMHPPIDDIFCFHFDDDGGDRAMVFATCYEHATTLYCAWHLDRWGEVPRVFTARKASPLDLSGEYASLADDLAAGISGVAQRDDEKVWRIMPPDWEPAAQP
jgi:hypothetical protein